MKNKTMKFTIIAGCILLLCVGCQKSTLEVIGDGSTDPGGEPDSDTDADTDADNDIDTDADSDSDTDTDNDTDSDSDGDSDADSDIDGDSDSDSDTDTVYVDEDGDLWVEEYDCDDSNPDINPGADEIFNPPNGVDEDCDGLTDEEPEDPDWDSDTCDVPEGELDGETVPAADLDPPDSFNPVVQWSWDGEGDEVASIVTPLVANLTDDDASGDIDMCDTPDIVVVVGAEGVGSTVTQGHIYVLDGAEGTVHFKIENLVDCTVTPALGDIDDDGVVEIVTATPAGNIVAFEHDGTFKWQSTEVWTGSEEGWNDYYSASVALADLDNDGDVEIIAGKHLFSHDGAKVWSAAQDSGYWSASAAADLDDDGDLEVILGNAAYHHDGSEYYYNSEVAAGYPQIADLDTGSPGPEILISNENGLALLDSTGATIYKDLRPTGDPVSVTGWLRPATVHDFDGDGNAEFAVSSANHYTVYEWDGEIVWSGTVLDQSGIAAGTAFDFLSIGMAQAMYADETNLFIYDGFGETIMQSPRCSGTLSEYPVVADVDNDGSAEIVVVSNIMAGGTMTSPTLQVIADSDDLWVQARRIWNQHTYHVTNVAENGAILQYEPPSWEVLNTYRTNAQIVEGSIVDPEIGKPQ